MAEAFTQSEAENNPSMKALNELIIPARKSFHQFIRNKSKIVVGIKKGLKSRLKQKSLSILRNATEFLAVENWNWNQYQMF